jgi:hypothetical protein
MFSKLFTSRKTEPETGFTYSFASSFGYFAAMAMTGEVVRHIAFCDYVERAEKGRASLKKEECLKEILNPENYAPESSSYFGKLVLGFVIPQITDCPKDDFSNISSYLKLLPNFGHTRDNFAVLSFPGEQIEKPKTVEQKLMNFTRVLGKNHLKPKPKRVIKHCERMDGHRARSKFESPEFIEQMFKSAYHRTVVDFGTTKYEEDSLFIYGECTTVFDEDIMHDLLLNQYNGLNVMSVDGKFRIQVQEL